MKLVAYSKALYSNWIFLEPLRLLLDAGEGLCDRMEGRLLAVRDVLLTHAHLDHYLGLHNLVVLQLHELSLLREGKRPRLRLTYPAGSETFKKFFTYLEGEIRIWEELVELHPVEVGQTFALQEREDIVVTALHAQHVTYEPCFGYRIAQQRWQWKPELQQMPQAEVVALIKKQGRDSLRKAVFHPLIVFSGDGKPLSDPEGKGASLLIHEATYFDPLRTDVHSTVEEALEVFEQMQAERLLLMHLSARYTAQEAKAMFATILAAHPRGSAIQWVLPGEVLTANVPLKGFD